MTATVLEPQPIDNFPEGCDTILTDAGVSFTGGKGIVLGIVTSVYYPVGVNLTITHGTDPPVPVSITMATAPMQTLTGPFPDEEVTITFDVTEGVLVGLFYA